MHELAIVEGILGAVIPQVEKYGGGQIVSIKLKLGEMAGIIPSCVEEYFGLMAKGTIAEGARLDMEFIPVAIRCNECGYEGGVERHKYICPDCGSVNFRITAGREYFVDSVEVEDDEPSCPDSRAEAREA